MKTKLALAKPKDENTALSRAWSKLPKELKEKKDIEGAFKTGFRLGWKAALLSLILFASTAFAQKPLGTFTRGAPRTNGCPAEFTCYDFTVTIPGYPYSQNGSIAIKSPPQVTATDIFIAPVGGGSWWGGNQGEWPLVRPFFDSLTAQGHRIVQIKSTWIQTRHSVPIGFVTASCRVATAVRWLKDNYPSPQYNLIGQSGGSAAVAYVLANYPIASFINKAAVCSGPPFMEIAAGCKDLPGYAYGSSNGKPLVDASYGFPGFTGVGPCATRNLQWEPRWNLDSVESGLIYFYPNTAVHVVIGARDAPFITNRGRDYYDLLRSRGENATFHLLPTMGHNLRTSQDGLNKLKAILQ